MLLFADDVVLLAENPKDMQVQLDEVSRFSSELDVKFSNEKCKYSEF